MFFLLFLFFLRTTKVVLNPKTMFLRPQKNVYIYIPEYTYIYIEVCGKTCVAIVYFFAVKFL